MKELDFESLKHAINEISGKKVLVTFHSIGDTDSVSSSFAIRSILKNAAIATPDFITGNSRRILKRFGFDDQSVKTEFDRNADAVVLLDVNNFADCGAFRKELEGFRGRIIIIDHHTPNPMDQDNVYVFNDESYNSTASIVYEIMKSLGFKANENTSRLIAAGIISDSAELRNAFPNTFVQLGELLQNGGMDYQSLLLDMQHIAPVHNREGFITDLFSSKIIRSKSVLMLYGSAHVHANKIADDAIKIGADVALFYTSNNAEISFSARLRPTLDREYGINLGRIMKSLAPLVNGQGGGHPCAAGAYGSNRDGAQLLMERFIEEIREKTSGKGNAAD
ncbi:MAG: DHH family phosphoesterase [Candidatus Micrarchaeota archaeon]|nr:DHH family phosphoesterase [Candidatus Micrarchaeota archaeon]